ncbi:MAG: hypothetical protein ABL974_09275 [Prosthecobacter sp.]
MKRTLKSVLFLAAALALTTQVQSAPVNYSFTGTKTSGDAFFGGTVTGTITLDLTASPTGLGEWRNVPDFKITAQAVNFSGGTGTSVDADDTVYRDSSPTKELSWFGLDFALEGSFTGKNISLVLTSAQPDVSDPKNDILVFLSLNETFYDALGGSITYDSIYSVALTPVVTSILIDGIDTGISDFDYQGQALSVILANYAANAKNHGDYVSKVEKLAAKLVKAKLLTKAQAKSLTKAAEKSNIGKKPKKDDKCHDDDDEDKDGRGKDNDDD